MTRPNILIVLCDQMRGMAMSCAGDHNVKTPALDRLAENGVRFSAACSTYPVCVPARFTMMTGQYAHTRLVPSIGYRMSPAERTIAHVLNEEGYQTAYIGKWHLYGDHSHINEKSRHTPVPRAYQGGFEYWRGFELCNSHFGTVYFHENNPTPHAIEGYQTDGLFQLADTYLTKERDTSRPFFLVLSVEPPHPPLEVPDMYWEKWRNRSLHLRPNVDFSQLKGRGKHCSDALDDVRTYYGMIENLDYNVGELMGLLAEKGLNEQTIVVFLSDHGEMLGSHGLVTKQQPYEESINVPSIFTGPGIRKGILIDDPICTEDLFPTILGLAGVSEKREHDQCPGINLVPYLADGKATIQREAVYLQFVSELRHQHIFYHETWRGIRTRRYKYVVKGDAAGGVPWLLFDLSGDPCEQTNLLSEEGYEGLAKEFHGRLRKMLLETGDDYVLKPAFGYAGVNIWKREDI